MRHKHWRNRAYKFLREQNKGMTASEILAHTKTKYSPGTAGHAAQLLRVDSRFFCYMGRGGGAHGWAQVMLYEVYDNEE